MNSRKIIALTIVWLGFNTNTNAQVEQLKKELSQLNKSLHGLQATVHNLSQNGLVPLQEKLLELAHPRSPSASPKPKTPPPSPKLSRPSTSQANGVKPQQEFKKITPKDLDDMNFSFIYMIKSNLHAAILENIINFQLIPYEDNYSASEKKLIVDNINSVFRTTSTKSLFNQLSLPLALNTLNKKFNGTINYSNDAGPANNTIHEKLLEHKRHLHSHKNTYLIEENDDLDFEIDKHNGFSFFNLDVLKKECQDLTSLKEIIISIFRNQKKEADSSKKELILKNADSLKKDGLINYRKTIYSLDLLETLEKARLQPQAPEDTFTSNIKSLRTQLETERSEIIQAYEEFLKKIDTQITPLQKAANIMEQWNPLIDKIKNDIKEVIKKEIIDDTKIIPAASKQILIELSVLIETIIMPLCTEAIIHPELYPPLKFLDTIIELAKNQNITLRVKQNDEIIKKLLKKTKELYTQLSIKEILKDQSTMKDYKNLFATMK